MISKKKVTAIVLSCSSILGATACAGQSTLPDAVPVAPAVPASEPAKTSELQLSIEPEKTEIPAPGGDWGGLTANLSAKAEGDKTAPASKEALDGIAEFAMNLLRDSYKGKSIMVSPMSAEMALSMTANGAGGATLSGMEKSLGADIATLNTTFSNFRAYVKDTQSDKLAFNIANSIWINSASNAEVNEDFLQKDTDYYGAKVFSQQFDDKALSDINAWVNYETMGMIPTLLDDIDGDAVMYLINALAFDGKWQNAYEKDDVSEDIFTTEDGREISADFMRSTENTYIEGENYTGFIKYYDSYDYAFAALLPSEGVTIEELLSTMDGAKLRCALADTSGTKVYTLMPKFEGKYSFSLKETLKNMGMEDAFNPNAADFTSLAKGPDNIFVGDVIQSTFISVDENGTKAAAATAVSMTANCLPMEPPKEVYLQRPFVYVVMDTQNNFPLFLGTCMYVGE